MDFLKRAETYAESIDDHGWFSHYYTIYREEHQMNVHDSVYSTLCKLYGDDVARQIHNDSKGLVLTENT